MYQSLNLEALAKSNIRGNTWHGVAQNRGQANKLCLMISPRFVLALLRLMAEKRGGGTCCLGKGELRGREQWGSTRNVVAAVGPESEKRWDRDGSHSRNCGSSQGWEGSGQECGVFGDSERQHGKMKQRIASMKFHPKWLGIIILLDRLFCFWGKMFPSLWIMYFGTSLKFNVYSFWISKISILTPITINI